MTGSRKAAVVLCLGSLTLAAAARAQAPSAAPPAAAEPAAEAQRMANEVRASIAGKEQLPAKDVFMNVMIFPDMPADRFLRIMENGWARALGVDCLHCHVAGNWASDEKRAKKVARGMTKLVATIRTQLKTIEALGDDNPNVNCTTCHRGQVKPSGNLGPPRS
jgi:hypothetical protein